MTLEIVEVAVRPRYSLLKALMAPTIDSPPTVRRFADNQLQESINRVLAGLPDESKAVELDIEGNAHGVTGVIAAKLGAGWSLVGGIQYRPGEQWSGQVVARRVWK